MAIEFLTITPSAVGGVVTVLVSLIASVLQYLQLRNLKRENKIQIWSQIASVKALMRHLERQDIHQGYGQACQLARELFEKAVRSEKNFGPKTIELWRSVGKISSDWQEREILLLLSTKEIAKRWSTANVESEVKNRVHKFDDVSGDHEVARLSPNWRASTKPHVVGGKEDRAT